jgi:hypothetical protein
VAAAKEFPRARTRRISLKKIDVFLASGATIAFGLFLHALAFTNKPLFAWLTLRVLGYDILGVKVLDVSAAAALMSAFISLLFLRFQFVHATIPVFDYRIFKTTGPVSIDKDGAGDAVIYVVELRNASKGVGIVTAARYWIEFQQDDRQAPSRPKFLDWFQNKAAYSSNARYRLSYHDVEEELERRGYQDDVDWAAVHFGEWSAFGADESRRILVVNQRLGNNLVAFDLLLDYETVLGDRFRREIYMIPRRQLQARVPGNAISSPPPVCDARATEDSDKAD